jgi:hypothetical protein
VAFYSLETAVKMCDIMPNPSKWDEDLFRQLRQSKTLSKFGHERRGTARNIEQQVKMFDQIAEFIPLIQKQNKLYSPKQGVYFHNNTHFKSTIQKLPQHSVWASFKLAEIFEKSLGYNQFTIHDLGLEGRDPNSSDGPIGGLRVLFGQNIQYDKDWFDIWNRFGSLLAQEWGVDMGEVETCFCKFYKLHSGKYYVGHDINEFYELKHVLSEDEYKDCVDFDSELLKQTENYKGVNKDLKQKFRDQRMLVNKHFADKLQQIDIEDIILQL